MKGGALNTCHVIILHDIYYSSQALMLGCWRGMDSLAVVEVVLSHSAPNKGCANIYLETEATVRNVRVCVRMYWCVEKKNLLRSSLMMLKVIFQDQWHFQRRNSSSGVFLMPLGSAELCSCPTSPLHLSYPARPQSRHSESQAWMFPSNQLTEPQRGRLHVCSCLIPVQPWAAAAYQPTFVNN